MRRHLLDGLLVHPDGPLEVPVVSVESAEVEEGGDLGGLVRAGVLQAGPVQLRTVPVHLRRLCLLSHQAQYEAHVEVRH